MLDSQRPMFSVFLLRDFNKAGPQQQQKRRQLHEHLITIYAPIDDLYGPVHKQYERPPYSRYAKKRMDTNKRNRKECQQRRQDPMQQQQNATQHHECKKWQRCQSQPDPSNSRNANSIMNAKNSWDATTEKSQQCGKTTNRMDVNNSRT